MSGFMRRWSSYVGSSKGRGLLGPICWGETNGAPKFFGAKGSWVDVGGFSNSWGQELEEFFEKRV